MTPNTQKRLYFLLLSSQIILIGISLVFSLMTLVITVLQPVFIMAAQWNDLSWFVINTYIKNFNEQAFLHELASVKCVADHGVWARCLHRSDMDRVGVEKDRSRPWGPLGLAVSFRAQKLNSLLLARAPSPTIRKSSFFPQSLSVCAALLAAIWNSYSWWAISP
jgi:hypothetical protein